MRVTGTPEHAAAFPMALVNPFFAPLRTTTTIAGGPWDIVAARTPGELATVYCLPHGADGRPDRIGGAGSVRLHLDNASGEIVRSKTATQAFGPAELRKIGALVVDMLETDPSTWVIGEEENPLIVSALLRYWPRA